MSSNRGNPKLQSRVPEHLYEWVERRAEEEKRTKANFVRKVLLERREREESEGVPA